MAGERLYEYHVYSQRTRALYVLCWALIAATGVALILLVNIEGSVAAAVLGALMALVAGFVTYRLVRSLSIEVYADSVVVRGLMRTRKLGRSEIEGFMAAAGTNAEEEAASALAVRTRDGRVTIFVDFRSDIAAGSVSIERLAEQLNRVVAA